MSGNVLVNTVEDKRSNYTERNYSCAVLARKVQNQIGRPSLWDYLKIIEGNLLHNCPVTRADIMAAEDIFGPNLGSLKGKTVCKKGEPVELKRINIPILLMERYRDVTLAADIMSINKIWFFVSISHHIKFRTGKMIKNMQSATLLQLVKQIKQLYMQRGFQLIDILMDGQFEPLQGDLAAMGIQLNTVSNDEHVSEIKHYIRTVKECVQSIYNTLPFQWMPGHLIIEMLSSSILWLNMFPPHGGGLPTISPHSLVTGCGVDFMKHC